MAISVPDHLLMFRGDQLLNYSASLRASRERSLALRNTAARCANKAAPCL